MIIKLNNDMSKLLLEEVEDASTLVKRQKKLIRIRSNLRYRTSKNYSF